MSDDMRIRNPGLYAAMLWLTPASLLALFGGMSLLGGFIPPPSPALSPAEVTAIYAGNAIGIKLTGIMLIFTPALLVPMTVVISILMWRSEGRLGPLALTQLIAGLMTLAPFILTGLCWAVAAYRPDRDPQSVMLMNDLAWVSLEMVTPPAMVQFGAVAVAILTDRAERPFLPRWSAYFSLWVCVLFFPGLLVTMFQTGPFAWNGILSFWVAAAAYGSWLLVFSWLSLQAVRRG